MAALRASPACFSTSCIPIIKPESKYNIWTPCSGKIPSWVIPLPRKHISQFTLFVKLYFKLTAFERTELIHEKKTKPTV
jgi:hypothetical protein